jgi:Putative ParB-like nuclease
MTHVREPIVHPIPILSLRPTQMTVGMKEVKEKRQRWRQHKSSKKQNELLGRHMIPVVHGPDERFYVIDHHHLARALHDEGVSDILVSVVADLTMVDRDAFWVVLDDRKWVYPYDADGERRHYRGSKNRRRPQGRSFSQPRRRAEADRRLCQGYDAIFRIPLGGFPASQDETQERRARLRQGAGKGAGSGQEQGGCLFAWLVRACVGRLVWRLEVQCRPA